MSQNENQIPECKNITDQEAETFFKAVLDRKVLVKDFEFEGATFYQVNDLHQIKFQDMDEESAISTALHLLLCNGYLLIVNVKSPVTDQVEDGTKRHVFLREWKKVKAKKRFLVTSIDLLVSRKSASPN